MKVKYNNINLDKRFIVIKTNKTCATFIYFSQIDIYIYPSTNNYSNLSFKKNSIKQ